MKNKKGQIQALVPIITALVGVGVVLVVGFLIMAEVQDQVQSVDGVNATGHNSTGQKPSIGWNATQSVQGAMEDIPGWLSIIVITMIGAILLGLVSMFRASK